MERELIELLKRFVEKHSNTPDLQFDPDRPPKLPIDPYSTDPRERRRTAHYLLLVASIDEGNVVGRADNARKLLVRLYQHFGEDLFKITDEGIFRGVLDDITADQLLGRIGWMIPEILASVNRFVLERAGGDLINYSREFEKPYHFVEEIGRNILRMGKSRGSARKKAWMYMRWMVRGYPDLRIFDHFSPADLYVPLDRNVARVAVALEVLESIDNLNWEDVVKVTEFARTLFPQDPAKVDYPFFLLEREMRRRRLPLYRESLMSLLKDT
ncbi:MAG TPA: DUF2400 family protein [Methanothermococcus okinawensis]|uniref:DUF2400 family protein n=1 Tax=Methanothermococcus okinawensis TaxID=155863 RepID=A0A833EAS2_9EURY|nr:DUF2400 family protein [Methanothermococcus okinawensis]